jgi:Predicted GTPase
MADIPWLIKGASDGKGLGYKFLKHIERNRIHLYLIDCQDSEPLKSFEILKNELKGFNKNLIYKPYLICRTKSDLNIENSDGWDNFDEKVLDISSINKNGLDLLVNNLVNLLK